jgi:hypothetical protein
MEDRFSSKEERIGIGSVDANMTVRAILIAGIRHIVLCGRVWVTGTVEPEIASAVVAFQANREHDRPL